MQNNALITRKSLIVGTGLGLLALVTGCSRQDAATSQGAGASPSSAAPHAPEWSYEGPEGPESWGELSSSFQTCSAGTQQSPIDVPGSLGVSREPLTLGYGTSDFEVVKGAHSIELRPLATQQIELDGVAYTFRQMHFHAPSEHTVDGVRYEAEFHFVHQSDDGRLAVLGVLAKRGGDNGAWAPYVEAVSAARTGQAAKMGGTTLSALFPASLDHYKYQGSLTTPPCSEGVQWLLLEQPVELGAGQLAELTSGEAANSRPTQPLNTRTVTLVDQ